MLKTRIAVFVSGGGTNLQALLNAEASGNIPSGEIVLVVSNNASAYALTRAERAGVPARVVSRQVHGERFETELLNLLRQENIDLVILAGFMCILSKELITGFSGKIINIHPSLIPSFCGKGFYGLRVHEAALAYGVKVTGATVHYVNEIPDGGTIILQQAVEVKEGDTPELLQKRVMEQAEWKLLPKAAEMVSEKILLGESE